ncbi:SNF2 family N-terminal domain-containing protein [Cristinia sonorae]|uniref:SNF2 family N-terminal domain-containing protein n=1 Tax=Cristinia sonorae TaxID=1940300 RepID=A0A8K0XNU3_9AGAR|nr:SNF2 family N-terminal domain-containing protein [Cristinia sonorae]
MYPTATTTSPIPGPTNQSDPIDLTGSDDEDPYANDRMCKRTCPLSRSFNADASGSNAAPPRPPQPHSGLSPIMSSSTLQPENRLPPMFSPNQHALPISHYQSANSAAQPPRAGPSTSVFQLHHVSQPRIPNPHYAQHAYPMNAKFPPPPPPQVAMPSPRLPGNGNGTDRQVIDLTDSPSPPPHPPQPSSGQLPCDLPPKTPVCIGLLTVTALVLYPVPYLQPHLPGNPDQDWGSVRLSYEHNANKPGGQETIHIRTPNVTLPTGEVGGGENFAVVEQKVSTFLGPMLGKGLIRLDGKVRRGLPNLPILPLQLLVFTPKGNIPAVSGFLHQYGLLLDHPTLPSDIQRLSGQHYHNPHNPPPGGHKAALLNASNGIYPARGMNRFNTSVSAKSVEVQRSHVDQLFKSMKDDEELEECQTPPEVATTLYPHQKKAVTFLLERERELCGRDGSYSSLWQERTNPLSGQRMWTHIVTQREVYEPPDEAKGAILADDMGLGKTITCVSLIAATLESAKKFASTALTLPPPPAASNQQDPELSAAHFQGSVWGMPPMAPEPTSQKAKAKQARDQEKADSAYTRACRIKVNSRATLIICPLSTVMNWEDQFREHWKGEVTVVGGGGITCNMATSSTSASASQTPGTSTPIPSQDVDVKPFASSSTAVSKPATARVREGTPLRVYVYHGNARKPDPLFLADFDAVITTYSTLATEFSKQSKSVVGDDTPDDDDGSDGFVETDERGNPVLRLPKPKKASKRKKPGCRGETASALQSVNWFRVVLDEAHSIKETNTVACRACCDLYADRRLCLTGTPVQNKLDDVFALIKFLRLSPFDDKSIWTEFIGTPVKYGQPIGVARLQTIMKCITLRRTKESKAENGEKILALPPRRDELRYLKFDAQEQAIYDQFFTESKAEFNELSDKNEVMKNYVGILQKILRLRQICDHFELVKNKGLGLIGDGQALDIPNYEDLAATISSQGIDLARASALFALLREAGTAQCVECGHELGTVDTAQADNYPIDADIPSGSQKRNRKPKAGPSASRTSTRQNSPTVATCILTRCQHLFCLGCFRNSCAPQYPNPPPDVRMACSICQACLPTWDIVEINPECHLPQDNKKKSIKKEKRQRGVMSLEDFHPSTKIKALIGDLLPFSRANPHSINYDAGSVEVQMTDNDGNLVEGVTKTVVFSQWTTMLDKVEDALEAAGIRFDRLDGTMRRDERTRAMDALKYDPGCEVLLVSLKAGGVGLNLTAAQRVYLMDPYWNPAVENQAVDRIHRLGQTRPVTTVKLIIENTIEARLLEVQKKKTELANLTLSQNYTKAEVLQRRMEELQQLFGS